MDIPHGWEWTRDAEMAFLEASGSVSNPLKRNFRREVTENTFSMDGHTCGQSLSAVSDWSHTHQGPNFVLPPSSTLKVGGVWDRVGDTRMHVWSKDQNKHLDSGPGVRL